MPTRCIWHFWHEQAFALIDIVLWPIFHFPIQFRERLSVILPNFAKIGRTVPEIWPIFDFSRWRPSSILDWFYACWDHPRRVLGGLCYCAKFGCNRRSNFDTIQILIFCALSLKMPIHDPKIGVCGGAVWARPQKGIPKKPQHVFCHVFAQTTHVVAACGHKVTKRSVTRAEMNILSQVV